jgi:ATP-dependent RNA helicase DeaD
MRDPEKVKMQQYVDKGKLLQHYYDVSRRDKFSLLVHEVKQIKGLVIVFCSTRMIVDVVSKNLTKNGVKAHAIHGGLTQSSRTKVMEAFKDGKIDVLVASDVAARGLDIKHVDMVVNYDIPKSSSEYVHRIGRTARAGCEGKVISFLSPEDHDNFRRVLDDRSLLIDKVKLPQFPQVEFIAPKRAPSRFGDRGGRESRYGGEREERRGRFDRPRR